MPVITFKTNNDKKIEVEGQQNLLRTSMKFEGGIPHKCGGGLCGTCKCKIEEGADNLDKVKKHEIKKLGEKAIEQGYRLACQTFVTGDVSVSWDAEVARKLEEAKRKQAARRAARA